MTSRLTEVIVDCQDLERVAEFWSAVLGYVTVNSGDGWLAIGPVDRVTSDEALRRSAQAPVMAFVLVPEAKASKNRVHVDVTPLSGSRDDEVERLVSLGARRVDIGQGDTPWVVMADPEGNEFCIMPGLGNP